MVPLLTMRLYEAGGPDGANASIMVLDDQKTVWSINKIKKE